MFLKFTTMCMRLSFSSSILLSILGMLSIWFIQPCFSSGNLCIVISSNNFLSIQFFLSFVSLYLDFDIYWISHILTFIIFLSSLSFHESFLTRSSLFILTCNNSAFYLNYYLILIIVLLHSVFPLCVFYNGSLFLFYHFLPYIRKYYFF